MRFNKWVVLVFIAVFLSQIAIAIPTITVKETELVQLQLNAADDDGDPLIYTFDAPLDANGRWQTTYGDAGEYEITVAVSDGKSETKQDILIIVEKSNRPPEIGDINDITVNEGETATINPKVTDYEGDKVTVTISEPVGDSGVWETGYDDAGVYTVAITASDGLHETKKEVELTVEDFNRAPVIDFHVPEEDIEMNEGEEATFGVSATDPEDSGLTYEWLLDGKDAAEGKAYVYKPDYKSAGMHEVKSVVSDGEKTANMVWQVDVHDVNHAPVPAAPETITAKEGQSVKLEFEASDADDDALKYKISEPLGNDGEWQTGYSDAGEYYIDIIVSDGKSEANKTIKLIVENVDRAPVFEKINDISVNENEKIEIELNAYDSDGEDVEISAWHLPEGAVLEGNTFRWIPSYDAVKKPTNWLQGIFDGKKVFVVTFTASNELSAKQKVTITVNDVNRAPILNELEDVAVNEGDRILLVPEASDPDGDKVTYSTPEPFSKSGIWQTGYDDAGDYIVTATASDGKLTGTKSFKIRVNNVNRQPVFGAIKNQEVGENRMIEIKPAVTDPDGDEPEISADNLPEGATFSNGEFKWTPGYDAVQSGSEDFTIKFIADDIESSAEQEVIVTVNDANRKPKIINSTSSTKTVTAYKGVPVVFRVEAEDPDGDELTYKWEFGFLDSIKGTNAIKRTFTQLGNKKIKLVISDGKDSITKEWAVKVVAKAKKQTAVKK